MSTVGLCVMKVTVGSRFVTLPIHRTEALPNAAAASISAHE